MDFWGAVKTVAPQLNAVGIRFFDHGVEVTRACWSVDFSARKRDSPCAAVVQSSHKGGQVAAHFLRGVLRGAAIQVGATAGGGGAGIGHFAGVAGGDLHLRQRHAQLVGHDLCHFGVQSLAHFGAAVVHLHAAVGVDMHQRPGLVEQRSGEADAKLDRGDGQAALQHRVFCIPIRNGCQPLLVVR